MALRPIISICKTFVFFSLFIQSPPMHVPPYHTFFFPEFFLFSPPPESPPPLVVAREALGTLFETIGLTTYSRSSLGPLSFSSGRCFEVRVMLFGLKTSLCIVRPKIKRTPVYLCRPDSLFLALLLFWFLLSVDFRLTLS